MINKQTNTFLDCVSRHWPCVCLLQTDMLPWIMWSWTSRRCWSSERRRPSLAGATTTTLWSQRRRLPARGAGRRAHPLTHSSSHCWMIIYSCISLFFSGPQTTIHCQRKAVSILLFLFMKTVLNLFCISLMFVLCAVTDDSEEWTGDEEEPISPPPDTADPLTPM